ncbi:MAG: HAMP domain-containing protein [Deltaproteobacteria bacterium]|nr:HAMP domain-containing protein [Deltaproteobacteria bacterium]
MRTSLLTKLIAAYLAPTLALLVLAPFIGYTVARRSLEAEVGARLVSSASAAAATLKPDLLLTLQPGDEESRTYRNNLARLEALRAGTKTERLYAFDPQRRLLVGTDEGLPIGSPLPSLERDRLEIERTLQGESTPSSVTFKGLDGRTYKSGYAPILDSAGKVVAAVGADASAEFFAALRQVGSSMALVAFTCGAIGLGLFFLIGRSGLLRPLRSLLASANRIGRGDLASPVPTVGRDELATLAQGMEQMRSRLFAREREMQMMLAGIAHEVRNPLGGIELFTGLLAEDLAGDPEKLSHIKRVQKELTYLKRVVEDFLGYARDPKISCERVEVCSFLAELAEVIRPDADSKQLSIQIQAEELTVEADAGTLRRALLNLARNAVQAAPEAGHVRLAASRQGDHILFAVEDDGPGVPKAARPQLFTPFHTTKEKGLGLGLAFVRRIAEAHGGQARLEPSSRGARFVLDLPAQAGSVPPGK